MQVVLEGQRASIICVSNTKVTFYKFEKIMTKLRGAKKNILTINRVKFSDSGLYVCDGEENGKQFYVSASLHVACKFIQSIFKNIILFNKRLWYTC